jgi:hypothetical protein
MKYLGLDVSTTCTGLCLLDDDGQIVTVTHVHLSKQKGLISKARTCEQAIRSIVEGVSPTDLHVCVEEAAQAFRRGLSSAKTIAVLNQFNGMVQLMASEHTSHDVVTLLPQQCRSAAGIKVVPEKKCGVSTKEQIREAFESQTGMALPSVQLKSGPNRGKFVFDKRNYDAMDAWVVARALWKRNQQS